MSQERQKNWKGKYFSYDEIKCKCKYPDCETVTFASDLLECLDSIREEWGKPIVVTSGLRCLRHNADVGGAKKSNHTKGKAVDIAMPQSELIPFIALCHKKGIAGIGLAKGWMHLQKTRGNYKCWFY